MDHATIEVPSSSANCGPGYDIKCVGIKKPYLLTTCTRTEHGVEVECKSQYKPPEGRILGYKAKLAAERFLRDFEIKGGVHLLYEDSDDGYPVGGLGRSGAEIVGALLSMAVVYDEQLDRCHIISLANELEGHPDNVAASVNGQYNIIARSPHDNRLIVDSYPVPKNLGLAIGFSSHKKTGGTEAGRAVLTEPVPASDFVAQTGLVSMLTAALVSGNTDRFVELVSGDRFHEPRRANVNFYGNFDSQELAQLKRKMFKKFHVGLAVSGAGPNMQFWYDRKDYPDGIDEEGVSSDVYSAFRDWGIQMRVRDMEMAKGGAYDYAHEHYGYGFSQDGF